MSANLRQDDIDKQRRLPESGCCTQMDTEQLVAAGEKREGDGDEWERCKKCRYGLFQMLLHSLENSMKKKQNIFSK